jgi:hypothetical protein
VRVIVNLQCADKHRVSECCAACCAVNGGLYKANGVRSEIIKVVWPRKANG